MKILLAALTMITTAVATSAHAGCSNYEDGSLPSIPAPRFEVCYDTVCDITTLRYECANRDSYQAGYTVGWTVDCQIITPDEQICVIGWLGRPIDPAKHNRLTFTDLGAQ